jgi:hypothetical protein
LLCINHNCYLYCCCVSIIIVICICPPGALIWLINLLYSILFYIHTMGSTTCSICVDIGFQPLDPGSTVVMPLIIINIYNSIRLTNHTVLLRHCTDLLDLQRHCEQAKQKYILKHKCVLWKECLNSDGHQFHQYQ